MVTAALFTRAKTWKQPRCPSTDELIKKLWYVFTITSAMKRNSSESVLMRWMNLEPNIQSEVSQEEKNKYLILMHIYGIQKEDTDKSVCRGAVETQTKRTELWTSVGEMNGESSMDAYAPTYVNRQLMGVCYTTQGTHTAAL